MNSMSSALLSIYFYSRRTVFHFIYLTVVVKDRWMNEWINWAFCIHILCTHRLNWSAEAVAVFCNKHHSYGHLYIQCHGLDGYIVLMSIGVKNLRLSKLVQYCWYNWHSCNPIWRPSCVNFGSLQFLKSSSWNIL